MWPRGEVGAGVLVRLWATASAGDHDRGHAVVGGEPALTGAFIAAIKVLLRENPRAVAGGRVQRLEA